MTGRIFQYGCAAFLAGTIAACGGGGGGSDNTFKTTTNPPADPPGMTSTFDAPTTTPLTNTGNLLISEVGTVSAADDVAWIEIYNPNGVAVKLSEYLLRSGYVNTTSLQTSSSPIPFSLPSVDVPAGGYLVVAGRINSKLLDNAQMVYVANNMYAPSWGASGAIELVRGSQTADFVRFGTSTVAPTTESGWTGNNVAALPASSVDHGKSIVRLLSGGMTDTNSASDWTQVDFATPGGRNDIAAGATDSDHDGIPDSAKIQGNTYAGLDLYAMGARPGKRDVFIELDYMNSANPLAPDPALTPRREALQKMVDAFAAHTTANIALHIDTGSLYGTLLTPSPEPASFNLGGGNVVPYAACVELTLSSAGSTAGCTSLYSIKSANFDIRRKLIFHYGLFANSQNANGSGGSSGRAEVSGNDFYVTLGGNGFNTANSTNTSILINAQASTLMHEFGHNLGLLHGGNENQNYKPNHYSVMNYLYQFTGLSAAPDGPKAADRYYFENKLRTQTVTFCGLDNSPCSNTFIMDYSDGSSIDLNEASLSEALNIGRGAISGAYADWDNNGSLTGGASTNKNINPKNDDGTSPLIAVLKDYNEWANLRLPFARLGNGSNSGKSFSNDSTKSTRVNPMNERPTQVIVEDALPEGLRTHLQHAASGAVNLQDRHAD